MASLIAASCFLSHRKRKTWEREQSPILSAYWSESYEEARRKFRTSCSKIPHCKTHSITVDPMEDLSIDIAYVPSSKMNNSSSSEPPHLVIHISGTHGVEGYAGSAIQNKLLQDIAQNDETNELHADILFIHSLNPFGMANFRRFNRYNVDLNRNTILSEEKWKELKSRDPNLTGYEFVSSVINPEYIPTYPWTDIMLWLRLFYKLIQIGSFSKFGQCVVNGQYHKATGIFYGGFQLQNEQKQLFEFIVNGCKKEWNVDLIGMMKQKKSKLTVIDCHTGIGPKGIDLLLSSTNQSIEKAAKTKNFPTEYFEDKRRLQSKEKGEEIKEMYKFQVGGVRDGIIELFQNECDNVDQIALTQEFGTVPGLLVLHALIMENAIYNLHLMDERGQKVLAFRQEGLKNVFYLHQDVRWKYDVAKRGVALFNCLANR